MLPKSLKQPVKCYFFAAFFLTILFCSNKAHAQTDSVKQAAIPADSAGHPYVNVTVQAKFPGGVEGWLEFIQKNVRARTPVKRKAPPGRYTVIVSFSVDTTGNVFDIKIDQDPGYGCAEDVLRLFQKSPHWTPAILNGRNVLYRQRQMITYEVGS